MIEEILQEELEKYFSHIGQIGQYLRENLDEVFTLFDEASKYVGWAYELDHNCEDDFLFFLDSFINCLTPTIKK